jgi:hypothetical protein
MREHFGAVEADFQSHYGLDLRMVLWGPEPIGVRRVYALVSGLPLDGTAARSLLYGGRAWSNTDELLATLVEMLDFNNRMTFAANVKKGTRIWEPVEINRPSQPKSEEPQKREQATPAQMFEAFGRENIVYDYREGD